jgi:hypothetical protein
MGYRPPRALEYEEYEEYEKPIEKSLMRRPSTTRKVSKNDEDRKMMPPPPRRPASARPGALAFRPPPQTPARRRVDLDEHDPDVDEGLFRDLSPLAGSYEYTSPLAFRPRPSFGAESAYDQPDYQTEVAGKHQRRNSYYAGGGGNSASSGSAYEDKIRQATRYQDDAARYTDDTGSGPNLPLTAEALRKAGRSGASSRSTRSSGSHDESDYRQSATTRTTRSTAPNDEDVTIRVKGSTVLKFGNTEMQCQDGAEINITSRSGQPEIRNPGGGGGGGGGSDRSSYVDPQHDDRRTRVDIPTSRARAQSRAKSRPRSFSRPSGYAAPPSKYEVDRPRYEVGRYDAGAIHPAPEYDNYSAYGSSPFGPPPPSYPEYPQYPSSYSSRHGDGYFGGPPPM